MFDTNIILFIMLLVLAWAGSDTFFFEFLLLVFSVLEWSETMSHPALIVTTYDYSLGANLFILNALYCFVCLIQWVSEDRKRKREQAEAA